MQWNRAVSLYLVSLIFESAAGGVVDVRRYADDLMVLAEIFPQSVSGSHDLKVYSSSSSVPSSCVVLSGFTLLYVHLAVPS